MKAWILAILCLCSSFGTLAEQCGRQAGGALCPNGQCCSEYGYCGDTEPYCKIPGCQSQCDGGGGGGGVDSLVSRALFDQMLKHRNGFYTYDAFVAAAKSFNGFATTGDANSRKREVAAFLGQTSHETTGGWPTAPDGKYAYGYWYLEEQNPPSNYCDPNNTAGWGCALGKSYHGRGPIQISYNYNYGPAGQAIGIDLINNPDLVAKDPIISFKTALWFWMTSQPPKPSCHDVITEQWTPSATDKAAGRLGGYGVITNIINGGKECDQGYNSQAEDRSGYYKRYCGILGVLFGGDDKLICDHQKPFGTSVDIMK